ncbi:MAG: thioesterase family protein [Bacteroidia bacterium]
MNHKSPIQLRFKDIDALGHVNNANHLSFFELARINYFNDVIGGEIDWEKEGMILARVTVDYKQPVYLQDKIFVYTGLIKTGNTSFELEYKLMREEKDGSETVMSVGTSVIVCYNYKEKKPVKIPALWMEKMKGL